MKNIELMSYQELLDLEKKIKDRKKYVKENSPCQHCSNHPSNGGSGICHCILGSNLRW